MISSSANRLFDRLALLLFVGISALFFLTCLDYGYSWDELEQNRFYGQAVLRFIQTLGADQTALTIRDYYLYGGLYDALAELVPYFFTIDGFLARRVANISIGLFAIFGTWKTARLVGGAAAGFWAMLLLVAIPAWYGHVFINAKDIPFAAGYIWSLYWILKITRNLPSITWKAAVGLGVSFGLAIGVRVAGVIVIFYLSLIICAYLVTQAISSVNHTDLKLSIGSILSKITLSLAIALSIMVAFWPRALLHPLDGIVDALRAAGHFGWDKSYVVGSISVLLNGTYVNSTDLPWYYLPVYFSVNLPIPTLFMTVGGTIWGVIRAVHYLGRSGWQQAVMPGLLAFSALFPPIYAILTHATMYDGIRHFLFILPPMACLGGSALADTMARLSKRMMKGVPALLYGIIFISLVFHVRSMIQLHPYQYAYLNKLGGGIPGGAAKYDTEYWITSYREATFKMLDYAHEYDERAGVAIGSQHFDVAVYGNSQNVEYLVPDNFTVMNLDEATRADFYIATTRYGADNLLPDWPVIAQVERMGMVFAVVKTSIPPLEIDND